MSTSLEEILGVFLCRSIDDVLDIDEQHHRDHGAVLVQPKLLTFQRKFLHKNSLGFGAFQLGNQSTRGKPYVFLALALLVHWQ